ncbi:MAG: hypothetical protein HY922_13410 [Elusimicrobia bacterium]|nr:hypothetical protein [Elusimicrobiota bacterium]
MLRKTLAQALSAALLIAQPGGFISELCAQTVPQQTGSAVSPAAGIGAGVSGAVSPVSLNNLGVNSPVIDLGNTLPSVGAEPKLAPSAIPAPSVKTTIGSQDVSAAAPEFSAPKASARVERAAEKAPVKTAAKQGTRKAEVPPVGPAQAVANAPAAKTAEPAPERSVGESLRPFSSGVVPKLQDPFDTRDDHKEPSAAAEAASADKDEAGWADVPAEPAEAPSSVKEASLDIPPGARFTPSPEDWRDEIIYSLVMDRFNRAKPFTAWGDPADGRTRHGGNIRGLMGKLDYLQGLGVTTLLINPLTMSPPAGYHQYWPIHFMAVDPQIGTLAEFKQLVAEAHKRGMRIVLDVVFNHTGPILEYEGGWKYGSQPKKIKRWKYPVKPVELAKEEHFHRRGSIDDWHNPEQVQYGDFPGGLNQLATENPRTQDILLHAAKWWIKETDVDGYRLDTYMHVHPSFWARFFKEIREYAGKLGKKNFLVLGELYNGDPNALRPELQNGRLDAAYNYPAYFWDYGAIHGEAPTSVLEGSLNGVRAALGEALSRLVRFLDNQDKPRFLREGDPIGILRVALAYVLLSIGIPYIYYGTEQAFRQTPGADLGLDGYREDMFPEGKFKTPSSQGDKFDAKSPWYQMLSALARGRKAYPALSRGEQFVRWSDPNGPGIYAFSRIYEGKEVLVVMNTAGEARSAQMWVDAKLTPPGTVLSDALGSGASARTFAGEGGGSKVDIRIPAHGVLVLVRKK